MGWYVKHPIKGPAAKLKLGSGRLCTVKYGSSSLFLVYFLWELSGLYLLMTKQMISKCQHSKHWTKCCLIPNLNVDFSVMCLDSMISNQYIIFVDRMYKKGMAPLFERLHNNYYACHSGVIIMTLIWKFSINAARKYHNFHNFLQHHTIITKKLPAFPAKFIFSLFWLSVH